MEDSHVPALKCPSPCRWWGSPIRSCFARLTLNTTFKKFVNLFCRKENVRRVSSFSRQAHFHLPRRSCVLVEKNVIILKGFVWSENDVGEKSHFPLACLLLTSRVSYTHIRICTKWNCMYLGKFLKVHNVMLPLYMQRLRYFFKMPSSDNTYDDTKPRRRCGCK